MQQFSRCEKSAFVPRRFRGFVGIVVAAQAAEIGSRGRADAVVAPAAVETEDEPEPMTDERASSTARASAELQGMRVKALKLRAAEMGVDPEAIADADDADDIKAAVIRLILDHPEPAAEQALREELGAMKVKALKQRAAEEGVDGEAINDADDADDIKAEVIRLILEQKRQ